MKRRLRRSSVGGMHGFYEFLEAYRDPKHPEHAEEDEIGLFVASEDVSASCAFRPEEWDKFVKAINEADDKMKKLF